MKIIFGISEIFVICFIIFFLCNIFIVI
jgi:cbb3-type cytochrome oxidase subunit 3